MFLAGGEEPTNMGKQQRSALLSLEYCPGFPTGGVEHHFPEDFQRRTGQSVFENVSVQQL